MFSEKHYLIGNFHLGSGMQHGYNAEIFQLFKIKMKHLNLINILSIFIKIYSEYLLKFKIKNKAYYFMYFINTRLSLFTLFCLINSDD